MTERDSTVHDPVTSAADATPPPPQAGLAQRAARGVLWTGGGQIARQLIQIAGQLALVRMLAPDDFGLVGMAMFFIGVGQLVADFGIGSAIVQGRTEDSVVLSSCFWLNMAVAGALFLAVLLCAPLIGRFYSRPDLAPLVAVLAVNLVLAGLQVMPTALLYRDMRFADLARGQVLGSLAGAGAAIAMAWGGAGVWSLAAQPLFGSTVGLAMYWRCTRWWPSFEFNWLRVERLARFSFALLGTNLIGYGNRNVDGLLIGRFLGAGPLGLYSMAIQIMLYPLQQISSVIVRVLFPTLVQIKDDLPRVNSAYLKAVRTIALLTFPLMAGLFALADDFVVVVLGPTWVEMAPLLRVLAWVGLLQSVGTTVGAVYLSVGRPELAFKVSLVGLPVITFGIAAGLPWGTFGCAVGYAIANLSLFYYSLVVAFRLIHLPLATFHGVLSRTALCTLLLTCAVLTFNHFVVLATPITRLLAGIGIGTLTYAILTLLVNRAQLIDILSIVRSIRRQ